jgi:Ca2+ transporting ATPase
MITLAFSIIEMIKDKCDVKKLASCEIMGGANNICSDKTGTLTNNIMEVVKLWSGKDLTVESTVKVKREVEGDEKSAIVLDENSKAIKESR